MVVPVACKSHGPKNMQGCKDLARKIIADLTEKNITKQSVHNTVLGIRPLSVMDSGLVIMLLFLFEKKNL